jgi:hypothetical protein
MMCSNCYAEGMKYMGVVDDCGDDGNQVCDEWECPECGHIEHHGMRHDRSWEVEAVDEIITEEEENEPNDHHES